MMLDAGRLQEARRARDRAVEQQHEADLAQVAYQHAIRRLHAAGASLREVADALDLSYQRVHQIVDVGSGKGAVKESTHDLACSFCGANQRQVRKLITGPDVYICGRCIDLAGEVIAAGEARSNTRTQLAVETDPAGRCNFCGKSQPETSGLVQAPDRPTPGKKLGKRYARRFPGVRICTDCLTLCSEIVAQGP